jgi:hypothetical protein
LQQYHQCCIALPLPLDMHVVELLVVVDCVTDPWLNVDHDVPKADAAQAHLVSV